MEGKLHPKSESSGKHGKLLRSNFSFRSTIRKSDSDEIGVGKEGVKHSPLAHSSSFRGNFKSTNVLDRENVFMTVPGAVTPISYFRDLEIQLAEAYFKRAQAKLYIESDTFKIEEALVDALKVSFLVN